jgi:hypothetical protein
VVRRRVDFVLCVPVHVTGIAGLVQITHYRSRCSGNNLAILAAAHGAGGLEPGPAVGEFTMVAVSHWLAMKQGRMGGVACVASEASNPSPIFREGLTSMLANSSFTPRALPQALRTCPAEYSAPASRSWSFIGVRDSSHLAEDLSATKASFPDAHVMVVGDSTKRGNVATALELGASSFA